MIAHISIILWLLNIILNGDNTNTNSSDNPNNSLDNKLGFLKNNLSSEQLDTINQLNNLINN